MNKQTRICGIGAIVAISACAIASGPDATPWPDAQKNSDNAIGGPRIGSVAPKWIDRHVVREVLELAATRRIDVVSLGDSNQLFNAYGWQDGWSYSLGARYEMYATPLLGAGADYGIGLGLDVVEHESMVPFGAPAGWTLYNDPRSGIDDTPYGYMGPLLETPTGIECGMRLRLDNIHWPLNNFDATSRLRAHFSYGSSPSELGVIFEPAIGQTLGSISVHPPINTGIGAYGIKSGNVDLRPGPRNGNDLFFRWFYSGENKISGPFFGLYMRIENLDLDYGFSNHTLYWSGGGSARLCAFNLQKASDEHLINFFSQIRARQPDEKKILIRLAFGGNDRNDSAPSVGPNAGFASNTERGVQDNYLAIINRLNEVWNIAGWDENELTFLLVGNHFKPVEPDGFGFRDAIADIAKSITGVAFVNLAELANPLELSTRDWYYENGSHLTAEGYKAITSREIAALIDFPEDLNDDCVVDAADLGILMAVFGQPNPVEMKLAPDFNFDGIIDAADLGRLLANFGLTCPE